MLFILPPFIAVINFVLKQILLQSVGYQSCTLRHLKEGGIGIFGFAVLDVFFDRFFGFCVKRLRFFGFRVQCGLRIFRFLASSFRFL